MKKKKMIKILKKMYRIELEELASLAPSSPPREAWEDQNIEYIAQSSTAYMMSDVLTKLKISYRG